MKTGTSTEQHGKTRPAAVLPRQRRNGTESLVLATRKPPVGGRHARSVDDMARPAISYGSALERALREVPSSQVGALGPQAGAVADWLVQSGHEAAAITLPAKTTRRPRTRDGGDRRWQVLVAVNCFEHTGDPERFLEHIKPLLAPEGRLIAVVPNITHASVRLSILRGRYPTMTTGHGNGIGRPLSAPEVEQLLNNAGFLVIGIERQMDSRETLDELGRGLPEAVLNVLAGDRDALTSSFVFIAQPIGPVALGALQRRLRHLADAQDLTACGTRHLEQRLSDLEESLRLSTDAQRTALTTMHGRLDARDAAGTQSLQAARETLLSRGREVTTVISQIERSRYRGVVARLRRLVDRDVPKGATVLVISRGDAELLQFDNRRGWHFPQADTGVYAGHHPADSRAAIAHLEALRRRGARYLVLPRTSFWWLEHYAEFAKHLNARYRCLVNDASTGMLFMLESRRR